MAVLEQVIKMKGQGISDGDIISELSQQGVSPKEISEALRQAQIKYVVSSSDNDEEMQPSMMPETEVPSPNDNGFNNSGESTYVPRAYEEQYQEQYYPQQGYSQEQYQGYYPQEGEAYAGVDTNTVMEISDQVFSDRIKKTQKQVDNLTETVNLLQAKMESVSDRLKKIETIIDKLQIAILEKIGSYGGNLESIKKEMSMMQDSFSKMISRKEGRRGENEVGGEEHKRKARKK